MAAILTTVESEKTTQKARIASAIVFIVGVLVSFGIIPTEEAAKVTGFTNTELFEQLAGLAILLWTLFMPAIQGWRSKDKELPPGTTTKEVVVPAPVASKLP